MTARRNLSCFEDWSLPAASPAVLVMCLQKSLQSLHSASERSLEASQRLVAGCRLVFGTGHGVQNVFCSRYL